MAQAPDNKVVKPSRTTLAISLLAKKREIEALLVAQLKGIDKEHKVVYLSLISEMVTDYIEEMEVDGMG